MIKVKIIGHIQIHVGYWVSDEVISGWIRSLGDCDGHHLGVHQISADVLVDAGEEDEQLVSSGAVLHVADALVDDAVAPLLSRCVGEDVVWVLFAAVAKNVVLVLEGGHAASMEADEVVLHGGLFCR